VGLTRRLVTSTKEHIVSNYLEWTVAVANERRQRLIDDAADYRRASGATRQEGRRARRRHGPVTPFLKDIVAASL
jgi:hypothetical protein